MAGDAYPTEAQFQDYIRTSCVPAFNAYTGTDFDNEATLDMGYFFPSSEGWSRGDHEVICYAIRVNGAPVSVSFKKAP